MTRRLPRFGSVLTTLVGAALLLAPTTAGAQNAAPPVTTTPPATSSSGSGTDVVESWALAPAGNRPNLSYSANQGGVIHDQLILANYGNVPLNLDVYATDAFNNDAGKFDVLPGAQKPVDVGTWVTLPQSRFTVMPRKQLVIPITIRVPKSATFGDHVGGIVASSKSIGTGPNGDKVQLDRRTGTRLYMRVNGRLHPHLSIANLSVDYHQSVNSFSGSATVHYRVQNDGNVRLASTQKVTVEGPFGLGSTSVTLPDMPELLPGQHYDSVAELTGVPALFLLTGTVTLQPKGAADLGVVTATTSSSTVFAPPITVLLVLLVVIVVVLWLRARRRSRGGLAGPSSETEPQPREPQLV